MLFFQFVLFLSFFFFFFLKKQLFFELMEILKKILKKRMYSNEELLGFNRNQMIDR